MRATGWGDDPYQSAHLDASKAKVYNFSADYRDIAYFDLLPSYADPQLARGIALDEQSFDTRRHFASVSLDLLPGNWIQPYFALDHDSGSGTGETTFVTDANEFPVPNQLHDATNLYRAGVHIERQRFHVTLEEGGTTFTDDQSLFQPSGTNVGNVNTPIFGQAIDLTSLLASYGVRGSSEYSKGFFTANPVSWLDVYGQFLFSQPQSSVNYQQFDTGNLLLQSQVLFYTSQQFLVSAAAKMPHTSGSFGTEIRPMKKLRITESWLTDRLHDSGSASTVQTLTALTGSQQMAELLASSLANDYNQAEMNVFYDVTNSLMLRGGYRYVWGDASDAVLPPEGLVSADQDKLRRNVGLGGFRYRPIQRLTITGEGEGASSGGAYFRTSLYDYQKFRGQARYQAFKALSLAADFNWMNNSNPTQGVNYTYRSRQESLSLYWTAKLFDFEGAYSRSTFFSDIGYLAPQTLGPLTSIYRENAHTATGLFSLKLPPRFKHAGSVPKLSAGGSFFISAGSRPTSYFRAARQRERPRDEECRVVRRMALLRLWRGIVFVRRLPRPHGHHRIEVLAMKSLWDYIYFCAAALHGAPVLRPILLAARRCFNRSPASSATRSMEKAARWVRIWAGASTATSRLHRSPRPCGIMHR